eukprot:scaffold18112_cov39-Phaeocystis_antarctica.AAC.1
MGRLSPGRAGVGRPGPSSRGRRGHPSCVVSGRLGSARRIPPPPWLGYGGRARVRAKARARARARVGVRARGSSTL